MKKCFLSNKSFFLIILFVLILSASLFATTQERVPYRLINSDHLQMNRVNDEYITYLRGNVHFFYDNIEFKSDRAEIYEKQRHIVLKGKVSVTQDTLNIKCHEAQYFQPNQYLIVQGDVIMTQRDSQGIKRQVMSNSGEFYRIAGDIFLRGNIYATSYSDSLKATAGYATYNLNTGYGYLSQKPSIWRTGKDSISISAEKIEFYNEPRRVIASFNVKTANADLHTKSNFLIYYGDSEKIVYMGNPRFFSRFGDGKSELITVFLENQQVNRVEMNDDCLIHFSTEENQEKVNYVKSSRMILHYKDNKPYIFYAEDNVDTFFVQHSSQKQLAMNNSVQSDKLNILFNNEMQVESIKLENVKKGKYRFERKK